MYSQTIHLTHELKSCIQIIRRRVDFNGDSTVKVPCRRRDSNRDHPTQVLSFAAAPSLQDLAIFMAPHGRAPFKWPVLWGTTFQWSPASSLEHSPDFPRACTPWKRFAAHLLGWYAPATEPGFGFVSNTRSSQAVSHPSTILAQCCLTSVFLWELVFPTWQGPLTLKIPFSRANGRLKNFLSWSSKIVESYFWGVTRRLKLSARYLKFQSTNFFSTYYSSLRNYW